MMDWKRLSLAALGAGACVLIGGMLMAGLFGYREMQAVFTAIGLPIPRGLTTFLLHTVVRLIIGAAVAMLYAIFERLFTPTRAVLSSAVFTWLLAVFLPNAVITDWGLFSWSLVVKLWLWGLGELLVAGFVARMIYRS